MLGGRGHRRIAKEELLTPKPRFLFCFPVTYSSPLLSTVLSLLEEWSLLDSLPVLQGGLVSLRFAFARPVLAKSSGRWRSQT